MDYIITTEHLTKKYKNFTSVNHVSLHIRKGSIYGFLGPNGAGKSTTMKMLLGLTAPTKGSFTIDGKQFPQDRIAILKEIGSFIEAPSFYANLTGRENLDIIRRILGLPKADVEDALELVGLTEFGDRLAKQYSLGMKQRLGLAGALLGRPPILILDEPTNGLDPAGMKQIRDLLKTLCSEYGITVMISSHILSEVESIADTVAIIHHGKMMKEIRMQDIEEMNLNYVELSVTDEKRAAYVLTEKLGLQNFKILDSGKIRIYDHAASTQQLTKILALNDVEVVSIGKKSETLEDYFLKLTGEVKYHA